MKINDITEESVKTISDKELLSLHYRLHQQYGLAKKRNDLKTAKFIKSKHKIVIAEMAQRLKDHKSPMFMNALRDLLKSKLIKSF